MFEALTLLCRGVRGLSEEEYADLLKGNALDIYRHLLTTSKPLGIREIQRALNLSSPSVAQYHLSKLEDAGLLKRESGNYVINKFVSGNFIKIKHLLIPRYLFYCVFAGTILLMELLWLGQAVSVREYFLSTAATVVFLLIFCFETARVWRKGSL
jgi:DNA-binding transcriptional ArsR family regulator